MKDENPLSGLYGCNAMVFNLSELFNPLTPFLSGLEAVGDSETGYIRNGYTLSFWCDPYRIQTCNLLIRSQILYSVELMGLIASTKVGIISISAKLFAIFLRKLREFYSEAESTSECNITKYF